LPEGKPFGLTLIIGLHPFDLVALRLIVVLSALLLPEISSIGELIRIQVNQVSVVGLQVEAWRILNVRLPHLCIRQGLICCLLLLLGMMARP
jgi:hypothetical protein